MRLLRLFIVFAVILCVPFAFWGGQFDEWFAGDAAVDWIHGLGGWGWLASIGLLVADIVLPVPATAVMSALGYVHGPWVGGAIAATGSFLAGLVAYWLCRLCGRSVAERIAGADNLVRYEQLFRSSGAWLVALSRWMPLMPEVIACLAGVSRMPAGRFVIALACGSLPLGFIYAAIGSAGQSDPILAIGLSIVLPAGLIFTAGWWARRRRGS